MGVGYWELSQESLTMRGLGSVVVLAGPNGGGKSRILRAVERMMQKQLSQPQLAEVRRRIFQNESHMEWAKRTLEELKTNNASSDAIATHIADTARVQGALH